jgi:hypothetical protein
LGQTSDERLDTDRELVLNVRRSTEGIGQFVVAGRLEWPLQVEERKNASRRRKLVGTWSDADSVEDRDEPCQSERPFAPRPRIDDCREHMGALEPDHQVCAGKVDLRESARDVAGEIQIEATGRFLRRFERRDRADIGGPERLRSHAGRRVAAEDRFGEGAAKAIPRTDEDNVERVIPHLS